MKATLLKTKTASLAAMSAVALTTLAMSPAKGQTIVSYNFNALNVGTINGQDGWTSATNAGRTPSQVATTAVNAGGGGTPGVTNGPGNSGSEASMANKSFFPAATLSSTDRIVLTFEAIQVSSPSVSLFGLGGENGTGIGIWNGQVIVRNGAYTAAIQQHATTSYAVTVTNDHWYSFKSEWDLAAKTATLYWKDLTAGDVSYTQLYFNKEQTLATVSLGTISPAAWNNVWLRVGQQSGATAGAGTGYLDNLSVVVVPEPHSVALGAFGLGILMLRARRRPSLTLPSAPGGNSVPPLPDWMFRWKFLHFSVRR